MKQSCPRAAHTPIYFLLSVLVLLGAQDQLWATVNITDIRGASLVEGLLPDPEQPELTTPIVYGGSAGDLVGGCAETDGINVCDNCHKDLPWGEVCNRRRIYPSLNLRIDFFNAGGGGPVLVTGITEGSQPSSFTANPTVMGSQENGSVQIPWSSLCSFSQDGDAGDATCNTHRDSTFTLRIGVDRDGSGFLESDEYTSFRVRVLNSIGQGTGATSFVRDCSDGQDPEGNFEGMCFFEVYPGDKKVYVVDFTAPQDGYPKTKFSSDFVSVRFFCREVNSLTFSALAFDDITPADYCADIGVRVGETPLDLELEDRRILGLNNDKSYYFRMASVDQAGNVGYFSDPAFDTTCRGAGNTTCHFAVPAEVQGLLSESMNCFIASAAFGSPLHPRVETLRVFRDQTLKNSWVGRTLIKAYYQHSPPLARWIDRNPNFKPLVRGLLWPLVGWSDLYLTSPWMGTLSLLLVLLLISTGAFWSLNRLPFGRHKGKDSSFENHLRP